VRAKRNMGAIGGQLTWVLKEKNWFSAGKKGKQVFWDREACCRRAEKKKKQLPKLGFAPIGVERGT